MQKPSNDEIVLIAVVVALLFLMMLLSLGKASGQQTQQSEYEGGGAKGPNIWLIRDTPKGRVYKFQDGPNDCYLYETGWNELFGALSCVKR